MKKVCIKCGVEKDETEFSWRSPHVKHNTCKSCHKLYRRNHYLANRKKYVDKAKRWNEKQLEVLREYVLNYLLTHPCEKCGENDVLTLDFHHTNGKTKDKNISVMMRNFVSLDVLVAEIKKCRVLCANCHRKHHGKKSWKAKMIKAKRSA